MSPDAQRESNEETRAENPNLDSGAKTEMSHVIDHQAVPDLTLTPGVLAPGTKVEVRKRFDASWAPGFEVVHLEKSGYRLKRLSDNTELPVEFSEDDVRPERRKGGMWWY
jgi:hypothetical protein